MRQMASFLHRHVPGFESSRVVRSGVHVRVPETRRITGDSMPTAEHALDARKFPDVIARCADPIDIHSPTGSGTERKHMVSGEPCDVPLRRPVPQRVNRLLVTGRCGEPTRRIPRAA
jgi:hypothetical protein